MKKNKEKRLTGYAWNAWKSYFYEDKRGNSIEFPDVLVRKIFKDDNVRLKKIEIIIKEVSDEK